MVTLIVTGVFPQYQCPSSSSPCDSSGSGTHSA